MSKKRGRETADELETIPEKEAKLNPVAKIVLSKEQQDVVDHLLERTNVCVIAKAGSGKSSLSIYGGEAFHAKFRLRTLIVTYNTRLKIETRQRLEDLKLDDRIECHSYHALAYRYFLGDGTPDDSLIHRALERKPLQPMEFGLVIIDEAQDMNPLYCKFVRHFVAHLQNPPTMLLVGDPFQRLFGFNGASDAYLMDPEAHFAVMCHNPHFVTRHLSISWRITSEMAQFINTNLNPNNLKYSCDPAWWQQHGTKVAAFWGKGIRANPNRPAAPGSVQIVRGWGSRDVVNAARRLYRNYNNDQVALLAFSLKGKKTPIQAVVDQLGKGDEENWVVLDGKQSMQDELFKGKRVATTVHRTKGLERHAILYCGMDDFIERLYPDDPLGAFNICYVGCTRAREKLVINISGGDYATVRCQPLNTIRASRSLAVHELVQYVAFDPLLSVPEELVENVCILDAPHRRREVKSENFLIQGRCLGTVEDLTPFLTRAILFRVMMLTGRKLPALSCDRLDADADMVDFIRNYSYAAEDWPTLIKYAVAYETLRTEYTHLWRQLAHYDASVHSDETGQLLDHCTENALAMLWAFAVKQKLIDEQELSQPVDQKVAATILSPWLEFQTSTLLAFHCPWFVQSHLPLILGTSDILFNKQILMGLEFSDSVGSDRSLDLILQNSIRNLQNNETRATVMLLTNQAQAVAVKLKFPALADNLVPVDFEFIDRMIRRKVNLEAPTAELLIQDFTNYQRGASGGMLSRFLTKQNG